jgi:hypothetical protein
MVDSRLPNDVRQSLAVANVKNLGEQAAILSNLAYANLIGNINLSEENVVSNPQLMNQLTLSVTGQTVNRISNFGTMEIMSLNG